MKKYILIAMLLLGVNLLTKAQQKMPTAQEMTVKSIDELDKRLKLNSTQKSVIYNYTFDMCKEQLELIKKQKAGASNEEDISKFYKFQNETNNNIKNVLKGDQIAEFDKLLDERMSGDSGLKMTQP